MNIEEIYHKILDMLNLADQEIDFSSVYNKENLFDNYWNSWLILSESIKQNFTFKQLCDRLIKNINYRSPVLFEELAYYEIEFIIKLEKEFNIIINDNEVPEHPTMNDLLQLINIKINERH